MTWALTCRQADCRQPFTAPRHRGRPPGYCSDACRRRANGLRPAPRLVRGHLASGPRPVLYPEEIAEAIRRVRMAQRLPRGERGAVMEGIAADLGVTDRTLYRYLRYDPPVEIRIGPYVATFATRSRGARRDPGPPVQLTPWRKTTETY